MGQETASTGGNESGEGTVQIGHPDVDSDFKSVIGDWVLVSVTSYDEGTSHLYAIGVDADHHLRVDESFLKPDGTYEGNVRIYTRY